MGLEAGSVHALVEGHSHSPCCQHGLWFYLHPPSHWSVQYCYPRPVPVVVVVDLQMFFVLLVSCRRLWWHHKDLGRGEAVLHPQPEGLVWCHTVSFKPLRRTLGFFIHAVALVANVQSLQLAMWLDKTTPSISNVSLSFQSGPVPPRHQQAEALLLLNGLQHLDVGPEHQPVCVRVAEPLQRSDLSQLQPRWWHHDQVWRT